MRPRSRSRAACWGSAIFLSVLSVAASGAQGQVSEETSLPRSLLFGRNADVWVGSTRSTAELLAVTEDSLWLAAPQSFAVALSDVDRLRVHMHDWDVGRVLVWNAVGAFVTGIALTAACSSVEDSGCGVVIPVTLAAWTLVGGGLGWALASSSRRDLHLREEAIRPYVRFPQGRPPGW